MEHLLSVVHTIDFLRALIFLLAFLLGSIPFGLLIAKLFHVHKNSGKLHENKNQDISEISSIEDFWPAGFITFSLEVTKGVLAVLLASPAGYRGLSVLLMSEPTLGNFELDPIIAWTAGFFAILGHCYSPWLHFKGGKGVATGLGVVMMLSPISALFGVCGFILSFLHRRIISMSSIAGIGLAAITHLVLYPGGLYLWVSAAMVFFVLMRHEANIDALLENREKAF